MRSTIMLSSERDFKFDEVMVLSFSLEDTRSLSILIGFSSLAFTND
jgi:hypothetical protein